MQLTKYNKHLKLISDHRARYDCTKTWPKFLAVFRHKSSIHKHELILYYQLRMTFANLYLNSFDIFRFVDKWPFQTKCTQP